MNCERVRTILLDGFPETLEASERNAFERHCDECEECRSERNEQRRVTDLLDAWEAPDASTSPPLRALTPRPSRVRPVILGIAAGLVAFVTLLVSNAHFSVSESSVSISFGASPQEATEAVAEVVERRMSLALEQIADHLRADQLLADQRFGALADAVELVHEEQVRHGASCQMRYGEMFQVVALQDQHLRRP